MYQTISYICLHNKNTNFQPKVHLFYINKRQLQNNLQMKFKLLLSGVIFLFTLTNIRAQVTIGSGEEPRKGSILDLKINGNNKHEFNANGGLGLPRVALVSPTTLTVGNDESKKTDHVGLTVYNITNNDVMKEGIYYWNGEKWMLSVSVNNYGIKDQLLTSNGDGTYDWSTIVIPQFSYHKPTQIESFDANKIPKPKPLYSYYALTNGGPGTYSGSVKPVANTFKHYDYIDKLYIQTDSSKDKYLLIGVSSTIKTTSKDNYTPKTGYWQIIQVDVFIDNTIVQSNQRLYSTASQGDLSIFFDMFSIIPLTGFRKGDYDLKVRISNMENTFQNNEGSSQGNFEINNADFYVITLKDVHFILYEKD